MSDVHLLSSARDRINASSGQFDSELTQWDECADSRLEPVWLSFWHELKLQCRISGPLIAVNLLQMTYQMISLVFIGHVGELELASSSIAISMANVTGYSVLMGMASGLETLCGQAYGAKQYELIGLYLQTGLLVLNVVAVFMSFVYVYMAEILLFFGQDKKISQEAGLYAKFLIPSLFGQACLQTLMRFLQVQSLVYPLLNFSGVAAVIHVPLCWLFVCKTRLGFSGAALSTSICIWLNVILLYAYIIVSSSCSITRAHLSLQSLKYIRTFLKLAIPSAAMMCLEWWCYEILILLSGLLPDPELQTSTLSACLNFTNIAFQISFGLSATISTRVSNALGAGQPQIVYQAVRTAVMLAEVQALVISLLILSFHNVMGYIFSGDKQVIQAIAKLLNLAAISSFLDSNQAILSGIARGCGWQVFGAIVNLSSFYIVALPIGASLAFLTSLKAVGLWIGIICGPFVQSCFYGFRTWTAKWENEVDKARERLECKNVAASCILS
ncbi:hypothetical protein KP509_31G003400 [Ceratopteris richardii]|uniref:Protein DETOXIFICATION n=1 Tax=Ceratopteris richardii TaxID=49495 RepID=A0A8T2QVC0_CERRI|nr:hypothetical protein KP509_31G003400 [Ceratopteris richardii]